MTVYTVMTFNNQSLPHKIMGILALYMTTGDAAFISGLHLFFDQYQNIIVMILYLPMSHIETFIFFQGSHLCEFSTQIIAKSPQNKT